MPSSMTPVHVHHIPAFTGEHRTKPMCTQMKVATLMLETRQRAAMLGMLATGASLVMVAEPASADRVVSPRRA